MSVTMSISTLKKFSKVMMIVGYVLLILIVLFNINNFKFNIKNVFSIILFSIFPYFFYWSVKTELKDKEIVIKGSILMKILFILSFLMYVYSYFILFQQLSKGVEKSSMLLIIMSVVNLKNTITFLVSRSIENKKENEVED